jgi:hypothetical protein
LDALARCHGEHFCAAAVFSHPEVAARDAIAVQPIGVSTYFCCDPAPVVVKIVRATNSGSSTIGTWPTSMSRSAWILGGDPRRILCGGTDRFGVGDGVGVGMSAEGVDELGRLLVTLIRRKDRSALCMPAPHSRKGKLANGPTSQESIRKSHDTPIHSSSQFRLVIDAEQALPLRHAELLLLS